MIIITQEISSISDILSFLKLQCKTPFEEPTAVKSSFNSSSLACSLKHSVKVNSSAKIFYKSSKTRVHISYLRVSKPIGIKSK